MSAGLAIGVAGIGAFLPGAPDWTSLRHILLGESNLADDAPARPAANVLPAAERRRAPDSVRLAAEVAAQACTMAHIDPASLPCVFASTHGEVAITDYLCAVLATTPDEVSPTKFHNSVLNAPAGYWTIATGCTAASSAVTACHRSIAAGLLEATVFAIAEHTPVLFTCCDVASAGPLAAMTRTHLPFGIALALTPDAVGTRLQLGVRANACPSLEPSTVLALRDAARDNPSTAQALALLAAFAGSQAVRLTLPLSMGSSLDMEITP